MTPQEILERAEHNAAVQLKALKEIEKRFAENPTYENLAMLQKQRELMGLS